METGFPGTTARRIRAKEPRTRAEGRKKRIYRISRYIPSHPDKWTKAHPAGTYLSLVRRSRYASATGRSSDLASSPGTPSRLSPMAHRPDSAFTAAVLSKNFTSFPFHPANRRTPGLSIYSIFIAQILIEAGVFPRFEKIIAQRGRLVQRFFRFLIALRRRLHRRRHVRNAPLHPRARGFAHFPPQGGGRNGTRSHPAPRAQSTCCPLMTSAKLSPSFSAALRQSIMRSRKISK